MKRIFSTLLMLTVLIACDNDETNPEPIPTLYFPPVGSNTWETVSPASLGWNESKIAELDAFMASSDTRALLVLKDGKMVIEKYSGKQLVNPTVDFTSESNWYWASAGKTLTSHIFTNIN